MNHLNPFGWSQNKFGDSFENELVRLEENPEQVLREVARFRNEVKQKLRNRKEELEKGIKDSPEAQINFYKGGFVDNSAIGLTSYAIAWYCLVFDKPHLMREVDYFTGNKLGTLGKISSRVYNKGEDAFRTPGGFADYRPLSMPIAVIGDQVKIYYLPTKFFDDIEVPDILKPFVFQRICYPEGHEKNAMKRLDELILHEYTHIYIKQNLPPGLGIATESYKNEINEGAAQAVSSIIIPSEDLSADFYRKSGKRTAYLQFFKLLFLEYSKRFDDKQQKIYQIRKRAVRAYKKFAKGRVVNKLPKRFDDLGIVERISLVDMVLDDADEELMSVVKVIWCLEEAEELTLHPMAMMNIIPAEEARTYSRKVDSNLESVFSDSLEKLFPDESYTEDNIIRKLYSRFDKKTPVDMPDVEIGEMRYERTEIKNSLKEVEKGLDDIERILVNENLSNSQKRKLEQFKSDFSKAINLYKKEAKIEHEKGEELIEHHEGQVEEIIEWYKETYYDKDAVDPVRLGENILLNLKSVVEKYETVISVGHKYNSRILDSLQKLHGEEQDLINLLRRFESQDNYDELTEFLEITEEVYEVVRKSDQQFKAAKDYLEKCEKELNSVAN